MKLKFSNPNEVSELTITIVKEHILVQFRYALFTF